MRRTLIYARLVRGCWAGLFFSQLFWWGWIAPDLPVPRAVMIVVAAGPLLLPLRGLLHDRARSYFWFNLLLMPYFAFAVAAIYAAGGDHRYAWAQLALIVTGFTAGFLRTRALRAPAG